MNPEALILRRCYPVPVTFADLRAAYRLAFAFDGTCRAEMQRQINRADKRPNASKQAAKVMRWLKTELTSALKQQTSAIDEVYAVVDGREVRVAVVTAADRDGSAGWSGYNLRGLLEAADEQGYWECPHEVRLDLSPRHVSHGEVARAVLVGQEALERGGVVRT